MQQVMIPAIRGLNSEGLEYRGFLYAGLMIDSKGTPQVLEFNCRFGDPEAQVLLPLLMSDPLDLFEAIAHGRVGQTTVEVADGAAACVVLASEGYPGPSTPGRLISGLHRAAEHATVYHAGTARSPEGNVVTSGGRVLGVTGLGDTLEDALAAAYAGADEVQFAGKTLRRDIGQKGLRRLDS